MNEIYSVLLFSKNEFVAFGASHLFVLAGSIAAAAGLVAMGRRRRDAPVHGWLPRALGAVIVVGEVAFCLYPVPLGKWRADWALPLQLCDMTAFTTGFGLLTMNAFALEVGFFLGLSATLLTTVTPDLSRDFPHVEFFCFFLTHALVSVAVVYVTFGLDVRPRATAGLRVWGLVNAIGIVIAGVNVWLGSNYLYICRKPPVSSPFDFMGPWPVYVVVLDLVLAGLVAALTLVAERVPLVKDEAA